MPTEIKGVIALRKALSAFAPDLSKELTKEITNSLKVIQKDARGYVPSKAPGGLYNWDFNANRRLTARNSMFRTFAAEGQRVRFFPLYDAAEIKRGIVYRTGYGKPNARGFRSLFRIKNLSAAGAIYETAGRKNPQGLTPSGSRFVQQGALYGRKSSAGDMRGRLLFRAWEHDEGKQTVAIFKAIDAAAAKFKSRSSIVDLKRSA
ncbi:hypothetical protein UFOVP1201_21 [uncultured Caudovirales phage]|uniref:Uncharacterized protein n=1 Tax=uncultured Caudovirales phage TaxID=2100421 RepID=A0A6J5NWQ4_9CAUD|nr:hypothetical protein UFOVP788_14 [uncultured Caudovirales phage]CAB4189860.1 hypothetical protein UFOVP1201_21 [uncultured Caudovirales phage]